MGEKVKAGVLKSAPGFLMGVPRNGAIQKK